MGRRDQLRTVRVASGAAAGLCVLIALTFRLCRDQCVDDRRRAIRGGRGWASVIASDVECLSVSPDDKTIACKQRQPGPGVTRRLSVLDRATGKVHPLAEARSIEDRGELL